MKYLRQLPLFMYQFGTRFWVNEQSGDLVFERNGQHLFVIIVDDQVANIKHLMIYNIDTTSHNSLVSGIYLHQDYFLRDNYLFTERIEAITSIYLFVFFGNDKYQFVKFEPNNRLVNNIDQPLNTFLSIDPDKVSFEDQIFNFTIKPVYPSTIGHQNNQSEMYLSIWCSNRGLKIESRDYDNKITYTQNENDIVLSMLDYFDGNNMTYSIDYFEADESRTPFEYEMSEDTYRSFILDSASRVNTATFAFVFEYDFLFVFYDFTHILEIYVIDGSNIQIAKVSNYDRILGD